MSKKIIIFDCDGTLVDSEALACRVYPAVWASMGWTMTEDEFKLQFVGVSGEAPSVQAMMAKLAPGAMQAGDKAFDAELKQKLTAVKGIPELLKKLTTESCVASNSSMEHVQNVLKLTNLDTYFGDKMFSAKQVAAPKPAPDLFLHVATQMKANPKDCTVVEDSWAGVQAAKSAGMKVIAFTAGAHFNSALIERLHHAQAHIYCDTAEELLKILNH